MHNSVNSPDHYSFGSIECIEALEACSSNEGFCAHLKLTAIAYLWRYEKKGGVEDLKKAQWYLERLIAIVETEEVKANDTATKVLAIMRESLGLEEECTDGFCPMPSVRQGPSELFEPIN
jgi:hypothetical protein